MKITSLLFCVVESGPLFINHSYFHSKFNYKVSGKVPPENSLTLENSPRKIAPLGKLPLKKNPPSRI